MKRILFNFIIMCAAFGMGLSSVWGYDLMPRLGDGGPGETILAELKENHPDSKVVVLFKGFREDENRTKVLFELVNLSDETVRYWSYEEKGSLGYTVRFNDENIPNFMCGTGLQKFALAPGDSIPMEFDAAFLFREKAGEEGTFRVGFSVETADEEYEQVWSDEFVLEKKMQLRLLEQTH